MKKKGVIFMFQLIILTTGKNIMLLFQVAWPYLGRFFHAIARMNSACPKCPKIAALGTLITNKMRFHDRIQNKSL